MSNTVKLVIEIPSEVYEHIKGHTDNWIDFMFLSRDGKAISAVKYGTPLDDVKKEIHKKSVWIHGFNYVAPYKIDEILDNIGKEDKE